MSIKILDCTLRDGGYINNWEFGLNAKEIVSNLTKSKIDIIELGFLRDGDFSENQTIYNHAKESYKYMDESTNSCYSLMIRPDWYDIYQLIEKAEKIQYIRFAFYLKHKQLTKDYCNYVRNLGYKIFLNPVNICSYNDDELCELADFVNDVKPEYLTIVDTFGSLTNTKLIELICFFEKRLNREIGLGCHLHDNMMLTSTLALSFLEHTNKERELIIDASLNGIGRNPGNLPLEILVDLVNDYTNKEYYFRDTILESISKYIFPIKEKMYWGYSPAYYLSGRFKVHRSYPEYYMNKNEITLKDIAFLLKEISNTDKRWGYDEDYANKVLIEYLLKR